MQNTAFNKFSGDCLFISRLHKEYPTTTESYSDGIPFEKFLESMPNPDYMSDGQFTGGFWQAKWYSYHGREVVLDCLDDLVLEKRTRSIGFMQEVREKGIDLQLLFMINL